MGNGKFDFSCKTINRTVGRQVVEVSVEELPKCVEICSFEGSNKSGGFSRRAPLDNVVEK